MGSPADFMSSVNTVLWPQLGFPCAPILSLASAPITEGHEEAKDGIDRCAVHTSHPAGAPLTAARDAPRYPPSSNNVD